MLSVQGDINLNSVIYVPSDLHFKLKFIEDFTTGDKKNYATAVVVLYLQCIAAIACAEFPIGQWLEVIDDLYNMVIALGSTEALKEQALQTIGYICEDVVSVNVLDTLFPNLKG